MDHEDEQKGGEDSDTDKEQKPMSPIEAIEAMTVLRNFILSFDKSGICCYDDIASYSLPHTHP